MTYTRAFPVELLDGIDDARPVVSGSLWFGMFNATPPSIMLWWLILKGFGVL